MDWNRRVEDVKAGTNPQGAPGPYRSANAEMVELAMRGVGTDANHPSSKAGMRVIYNISSAHVPDLLRSGPSAYKNCYDLAESRLGGRNFKVGRLRQAIDKVVAKVAEAVVAAPGPEPKDLYYGAVELNGTGVRYFGDFCLVLQRRDGEAPHLLLIRNSYDLNRLPVQDWTLVKGDVDRTHSNRVKELATWAGRWPEDAPGMAVVKVLEDAPPARRRLTTGIIAGGVLDDEDYIEVARRGSFGADDLAEIRIRAADAGAEARIGDRTAVGPPPSLAEAQWRQRRRGAERAATGARIKVRVVAALGRDRG